VGTLSTKAAPTVKERETRIPVKVTVEEKRKFERLAASRYTTVSELIRQLLHREADSKHLKSVA
jgi:ribosomal protein L11